MELTLKQKTAFGIGAVGKDMVYALSASYVMYYYQDVLGLSASFVGLVLMAARFFDAFNDPFMGVLVAKTRTRWGRFRPWIFSGTLLNALVLYALFAAPVLDEAALMVYFSVVYILWGVTYTMMDIPYWSMIPAVTRTPKDRENLSMVGRTCAGVGSALIAMFTMLLVGALGGDSERAGFRWVALIVSVLFVVTELVCCAAMRETTPSEMKTATVKEMFSALFRNDQAMVVVGSIVLINSALYLTSNFIIYFFKYDLGGAGWKATYTLFSTVGGAAQILGMMVLYPLLRKKFSSTQVFHLSLVLALCGYGTLLVFCLVCFCFVRCLFYKFCNAVLCCGQICVVCYQSFLIFCQCVVCGSCCFYHTSLIQRYFFDCCDRTAYGCCCRCIHLVFQFFLLFLCFQSLNGLFCLNQNIIIGNQFLRICGKCIVCISCCFYAFFFLECYISKCFDQCFYCICIGLCLFIRCKFCTCFQFVQICFCIA